MICHVLPEHPSPGHLKMPEVLGLGTVVIQRKVPPEKTYQLLLCKISGQGKGGSQEIIATIQMSRGDIQAQQKNHKLL